MRRQKSNLFAELLYESGTKYEIRIESPDKRHEDFRAVLWEYVVSPSESNYWNCIYDWPIESDEPRDILERADETTTLTYINRNGEPEDVSTNFEKRQYNPESLP